MWRSRRWRYLLNLIDQLPRNSRYVEAQVDDEELAAVVLAQPAEQEDRPYTRRMSEWSPEVEAMAAVVDRLSEVVGVLVVANGGKPPRFKPYIRPVTAVERMRVRQQRERHEAFVSRLIREQGG